MSAEAPAAENSAFLRLADGPLVAPVLARIVAMMLARADCPVDRLDDAMLICDALSAHAPGLTEDDRLTLRILTDGDGVTLRVGALQPGGAARLMSESALPGVGCILESIADELHIEPHAEDGEELVLGLRFAADGAAERSDGVPEPR